MKEYLPHMLDALAPLLLALLAYSAKKLADLINAKVANESLKRVLVRLDDAVFTAVKEVAQVSVDAARAAAVGGKLPAEVAAAAKAAALASVKSHLGAKGLDEVMRVLGLADAAQADAVIASKLEAAVRDTKPGAPMVVADPSMPRAA